MSSRALRRATTASVSPLTARSRLKNRASPSRRAVDHVEETEEAPGNGRIVGRHGAALVGGEAAGGGLQQQHEGQVHRIDEEALAGAVAEAGEEIGFTPRHIFNNPAQQRLQHEQRQGWKCCIALPPPSCELFPFQRNICLHGYL